MKVQLDFDGNSCNVYKEDGDPRFHCGYSEPESTFLYHVKKELIKQSYDVIKKRMWKDGHLVDDNQQYIRTRKYGKETSENDFAVYNRCYSIYDAGQEFNKEGYVCLGLE